MPKNSHNEGYYIIFQTDSTYNDDSFEEDEIKINQITINIELWALLVGLDQKPHFNLLKDLMIGLLL